MPDEKVTIKTTCPYCHAESRLRIPVNTIRNITGVTCDCCDQRFLVETQYILNRHNIILDEEMRKA